MLRHLADGLTSMTTIHDLQTPALLLDPQALDANIDAMALVLPGERLRPHVKAH